MLYAWTVRAGGPSQCKYGLSGYGGSPYTGEMVVRPSYLRDGNYHDWFGRVFILRRLHCIVRILIRCGLVTPLDVWNLGHRCSMEWPVTISSLNRLVNTWLSLEPQKCILVRMYSKQTTAVEKKTMLNMSSQNGSQSAQVLMCRGER